VDVALVPGVDLIPVSFLVTGLVFLVGIGLFRVFDLSSAARSALVEQTSDAVVVADADGRIVDANPAASRWLADDEVLLGRSTADVLAKWPALRTACAGKLGARMELTLREDPLLHVDAHVTPLKEPQGQGAGCFVVLRDITLRYRNELEIRRVSERLAAQVREIEALHEELREQAIRDSLTGLFNRRYLDEVLPREMERTMHQGGVLSVVMIDIDHFKTTNDRLGHREGDRLLALLGEVLRQGTRPADAACRYGGEEFLLVLPGASSDTAQERTESLRQTYAARLRREGFKSPPTLSGGIATFPIHARSDDALLREADRALYRAKAAGRDRFCVAEGHAG
jgi:diguanylate cyclase (GGDEF)-like protein/PAS domain S-box-containing protein